MPANKIVVQALTAAGNSEEDKDGAEKGHEVAVKETSFDGNTTGAPKIRCESKMSTLSDMMDICRICHCEAEEDNQLISPCLCMGSLKYVHMRCLQKWIKSSEKFSQKKISCELCKYDFNVSNKTKPITQWEGLDMSKAERRKIISYLIFTLITLACIIWSVHELINGTAKDVANGNLNWSFWITMVVVTVGVIGASAFMYIQCKLYIKLISRWRSYNKVLHIENIPSSEEFRKSALEKIKAKVEADSEVGRNSDATV